MDFTTGGGYNAKLGEESAKGIKSNIQIIITGGTLNLNCADDAIHTNGNLTLTGGIYTIQTGNDAVHADNYVTIGIKDSATVPEIHILSCYEGIEGAEITLYAGSADIVSSDDGINAANGDLSKYSFKLFVW